MHYKKLMQRNVLNVKVYCYVNKKGHYLAKKYNVQLVFKKVTVLVSVLNAIVNGNRKVLYIYSNVHQNSVPVLPTFRFKIRF